MTDGTRPLAVLLADDHARFREGMRERLTRRGIRVVGECSGGSEAVKLYDQHRPDVVVMDLHMPGGDGRTATAEIVGRWPDARVLMLTIAADEQSVAEAMLAGACGYVLKSAAVRELVAAIRSAAAGETFMSAAVAGRLLGRWRHLEHAARAAAADAVLSVREIEVLRLISEGQENADIAAELNISPNTVKRHVVAILTKLRVANRTEAAVQAVRAGLI